MSWSRPETGGRIYLIGSPAFKRIRVHISNDRDFVIEAEGSFASNPYIASATWNGNPFDRLRFTHEQIMCGGTLRLKMSLDPGHWGAG